MHDAKFGESTIFSDVAKKLKWLKTPWRESMVKYFPKWLTLFMFFVFIVLLIFFRWPDYAAINSNMDSYCKNAGGFLQFNFAILGGNAILIVLIGSIAYFYQDEMVSFTNTEDAINNIMEAVQKIDVNIEKLARVKWTPLSRQ